jgi:hypothetical protein
MPFAGCIQRVVRDRCFTLPQNRTAVSDFQFGTLLVVFFKVNCFFYLVCETIGTAATPGLFCQPRVIVKMIVEKQMKGRLAGEIEVIGENLPKRHFCPSQKSI